MKYTAVLRNGVRTSERSGVEFAPKFLEQEWNSLQLVGSERGANSNFWSVSDFSLQSGTGKFLPKKGLSENVLNFFKNRKTIIISEQRN